MTPATDSSLDALHATATDIFTGAIKACNIASAFDRRLRFEGHIAAPPSARRQRPGYHRSLLLQEHLCHCAGQGRRPHARCASRPHEAPQGPARHLLLQPASHAAATGAFATLRAAIHCPTKTPSPRPAPRWPCCSKARKDTLVFFLISGGGSAMFDLPLDPHISLDDTIAFHQLLLASGAPISEINTLRKHFSAVKGGRLAIAAPEAAKVSLLLPDVPLRSLDALSSGPTSPDHSTVAEVRAPAGQVRSGAQASALHPRLLRARRPARIARQQGLVSALLSHACQSRAPCPRAASPPPPP